MLQNAYLIADTAENGPSFARNLPTYAKSAGSQLGGVDGEILAEVRGGPAPGDVRPPSLADLRSTMAETSGLLPEYDELMNFWNLNCFDIF